MTMILMTPILNDGTEIHENFSEELRVGLVLAPLASVVSLRLPHKCYIWTCPVKLWKYLRCLVPLRLPVKISAIMTMMMNIWPLTQASCGSGSLAENNTYFTSRFRPTSSMHHHYDQCVFYPARSHLVQVAVLRSANVAQTFVSWGLILKHLL